MEVVSTYKYARISAQKARDVAREIQGLPVSAALDLLAFTPKKVARLFEKTMKTAIADAEHNFQLSVDTLFVKEAVAGEGFRFKRIMPRARGSASGIQKRTSHLRVVLSDEEAPAPRKSSKRHVSPERTKSSPETKQTKQGKAQTAKGKQEKSPVDLNKGLTYDERPDDADDLTEIPKIGAKLAEKLNSEGIYTFEQIANWTAENVRAFEQILALASGQIKKEKWVQDAKELLEDDTEDEQES